MTLTASDVGSLAYWMRWWERGEYLCATLVAVACFGEYVAGFTNWLTGDCPEKKKSLEKRSTLLLIAALALELVCLVRTNQISDQIIGSLSEKAESARSTSEVAISESDSALTTARAAGKEIEEAKGKVSDALSLAKQVETTIAWRHLSPAQIGKIKNAIPFSLMGLKVEVHHLISDREAQGYADEIANALRPSLNVTGTSGYLAPWGKIPTGVGIYATRLDTPGAADLQKALKAGGIDAGGATLSDAQLSSSSGIVIFVWPKPR